MGRFLPQMRAVQIFNRADKWWNIHKNTSCHISACSENLQEFIFAEKYFEPKHGVPFKDGKTQFRIKSKRVFPKLKIVWLGFPLYSSMNGWNATSFWFHDEENICSFISWQKHESDGNVELRPCGFKLCNNYRKMRIACKCQANFRRIVAQKLGGRFYPRILKWTLWKKAF